MGIKNIIFIILMSIIVVVIFKLQYDIWTFDTIRLIGKDKYKALRLHQRWKLVRHINSSISAYKNLQYYRETKFISGDDIDYEVQYFKKLQHCADLYYRRGNCDVEDISRTEGISLLDLSEYLLLYKTLTMKWRCKIFFSIIGNMILIASLFTAFIFVPLTLANLFTEKKLSVPHAEWIPIVFIMVCGMLSVAIYLLTDTDIITSAREKERDDLYMELLNDDRIAFSTAVENLHVPKEEVSEMLSSYRKNFQYKN